MDHFTHRILHGTFQSAEPGLSTLIAKLDSPFKHEELTMLRNKAEDLVSIAHQRVLVNIRSALQRCVLIQNDG